jgi:hypothetical protein
VERLAGYDAAMVDVRFRDVVVDRHDASALARFGSRFGGCAIRIDSDWAALVVVADPKGHASCIICGP